METVWKFIVDLFIDYWPTIAIIVIVIIANRKKIFSRSTSDWSSEPVWTVILALGLFLLLNGIPYLATRRHWDMFTGGLFLWIELCLAVFIILATMAAFTHPKSKMVKILAGLVLVASLTTIVCVIYNADVKIPQQLAVMRNLLPRYEKLAPGDILVIRNKERISGKYPTLKKVGDSLQVKADGVLYIVHYNASGNPTYKVGGKAVPEMIRNYYLESMSDTIVAKHAIQGPDSSLNAIFWNTPPDSLVEMVKRGALKL